MSEQSVYRARVRLPDSRARRAARALGVEWVALAIGDAGPGAGLQTFGTFSFTAYATGGVSIPGMTGASSVTMGPWSDGAGTIYHFQWNAATSKMQVLTMNGEEIDNAFDLSAIADHPYSAVLVSDLAPRAIQRLAGNGRILAVEFDLTAAIDADNADFWTLTAYLRHVDPERQETIGVPLGSYSNEERDIAAYDDVTLYDDEIGVTYEDSDRVSVVAVATGNPPPLRGLSVWAKVQREVF